jgi:predicted RNA-binding Zn-ribbon protein involved in translation (DUF1610 family)
MQSILLPRITIPAIFGILFPIPGVILTVKGISDFKDERVLVKRQLLADKEEANLRGLSLEQYQANEAKRKAVEQKKRYEQMLQEQEEQKQKELEEAMNPLTECDVCKKSIAKTSEACPHCGAKRARRCPKCMSANISRLTGVDKGISAVAFGVFAANTVLNNYQCNECREKFT